VRDSGAELEAKLQWGGLKVRSGAITTEGIQKEVRLGRRNKERRGDGEVSAGRDLELARGKVRGHEGGGSAKIRVKTCEESVSMKEATRNAVEV